MPEKKHEFVGKDVADALKNACEELGLSQEKLEVEIIDTGSTGIFGLIRKKARIRVSLRNGSTTSRTVKKLAEEPKKEQPSVPEPEEQEAIAIDEDESATDSVDEEFDDVPDSEDEVQQEIVISADSIEKIRSDLEKLIILMGFQAEISIQVSGASVECILKGDELDDLIGAEGKTIDSIQYLIRKISAKKCPERLRISVNVGNFRERRMEELKQLAVDLAAQVKLSGKTQIIPALNPSERREIHIILQDDKEVRSRSVGEGLFKKVLIYKAGKNGRSGRRKSGAHPKHAGGHRAKKTPQDE